MLLIENITCLRVDINFVFECSTRYLTSDNDVFDDFLKSSDHFPKISEDFWGSTDDVSIIQHDHWVLFKRLCSYSNGNLKTCDNLIFYTSKYRIFTCENILIFSVAEILIKHWCLCNKSFYCINNSVLLGFLEPEPREPENHENH